MKRVVSFKVLAVMMMITAMSVAGCKKNNGGDDPDEPNNPDVVNVVMQNVTLSGTVRGVDGNPLGGVRVTTGTLNATTGSDGAFTFAKAGTVNDRIIIQFEKSGYFTLTRSAAKDDEDDDLYVEAMLYPKGNSGISLQNTFDASTAKTLQIGGMTINFPASSVVRADGSAYSGTVRADVLYLAPDNENTGWMMPGGDLTCKPSNNSEEILLPYGITDVVLTDNAGNPLNIKKGAGVEISFQTPSGMSGNTPATLPQWTFDGVRGVWHEDGTLTRQGNIYKGTVNHFSPRAAGKSAKFSIIRARVTECDKPSTDYEVVFQIWSGNQYPDVIFRTTNSAGYCSARVPANEFVRVLTFNGRNQSRDANVEVGNYGLHEVYLKYDDECYVRVYVTACGEDKEGVGVYIDDKLGGVTYNGGYCFVDIPKTDEAYTISATYKGKTKQQTVPAGSYLKEISLQFDDDCDDDDNIPEKAAISVTHFIPGKTLYVTYDNFFKRVRIDYYFPEELVFTIHIYDAINNKYCQVQHEDDDMWFDDCGGYCGDGEYSAILREFGNTMADTDEELIKWGYKQQPDEIVAGKSCRVFARDGGATKIYKWKRIKMREINKGDLCYEVLSITENVPDAAFTQKAVTWIK